MSGGLRAASSACTMMEKSEAAARGGGGVVSALPSFWQSCCSEAYTGLISGFLCMTILKHHESSFADWEKSNNSGSRHCQNTKINGHRQKSMS